MKLYLSSNGTGANGQLLRDFVKTGDCAAIVFNALDVYRDSRTNNAKRDRGDISSLGFVCEELDLRQYFGDRRGLQRRLREIDLLWVVGGNTFSLGKAVAHSRLKEALSPLLLEDCLVYGGYSAGACITGPDLQGCHLMDDRDALPFHYPPSYRADIDPQTLDIVPWRIIPHWQSDHEESELATDATNFLDESGLSYRAISDGQVVVVNGDEVSLVEST